MTYAELFEYVDAEPFRPFRIGMVSGRTYELRHPEMIRVGENSVVVFQHLNDDDRIFESFKMLGLNFIKTIKHFDQSIAQDQD